MEKNQIQQHLIVQFNIWLNFCSAPLSNFKSNVIFLHKVCTAAKMCNFFEARWGLRCLLSQTVINFLNDYDQQIWNKNIIVSKSHIPFNNSTTWTFHMESEYISHSEVDLSKWLGIKSHRNHFFLHLPKTNVISVLPFSLWIGIVGFILK